MKNILNKLPILKYIIISLAKGLAIAVPVVLVAFGILSVTGTYSKLESVLNLKYNSPFITLPLYCFAALAVLSLVVGFLLYFHKYKRAKAKTKFYEALAGCWNKKTKEAESNR